MAERTVVESGVIRVDASGRRQYSLEFKRRLAKLALEPGASVAGIALAHRINANQLFKWRQDYLRQRGEATAPEPTPPPEVTLLPVVVPAARPQLEPSAPVLVAERDIEPPSGPGQIEVQLGRARVRVTGPVDLALVERILNHLHRR
ncbi:MAG: transposase [Candidatus Competibacteraceae bacterium]|nr:transposase [Candidatus Competibacteraceae bacterium]MBK8508356.1 transposase [Candidatus Competibacteraceae bacterium]MBK8508924.1 transposase [Candidatus Competibacteraceae bacterium]